MQHWLSIGDGIIGTRLAVETTLCSDWCNTWRSTSEWLSESIRIYQNVEFLAVRDGIFFHIFPGTLTKKKKKNIFAGQSHARRRISMTFAAQELQSMRQDVTKLVWGLVVVGRQPQWKTGEGRLGQLGMVDLWYLLILCLVGFAG